MTFDSHAHAAPGTAGAPLAPFPHGPAAERLHARAKQLQATRPGTDYVAALRLAAAEPAPAPRSAVPAPVGVAAAPQPTTQARARRADQEAPPRAHAPVPRAAQPVASRRPRLSPPAQSNPEAATALLARVAAASAGDGTRRDAERALERLQTLAQAALAAAMSPQERHRVARALDGRRVDVHERLRDQAARGSVRVLAQSLELARCISRLTG